MARQFLKITTPAADLQLLDDEELRTAVGIASNDSSQDTVLQAMGLKIAAAIMTECNIAIGSGGEPTVLQETLEETIFKPCGEFLFLSRRHDIELIDITVDGTALSITDIIVDPEAGMISRLSGGAPIRWNATKIVVNYKAGFEDAPGDLKIAASDFMRLSWSEKDRDPSLKSEVVDYPDIRRVERQYWVGAVPGQSTEGAVPDVVAGQLQRYRNVVLA